MTNTPTHTRPRRQAITIYGESTDGRSVVHWFTCAPGLNPAEQAVAEAICKGWKKLNSYRVEVPLDARGLG